MIQRLTLLVSAALACLLAASACQYHVEEELYPDCDTAGMAYRAIIAPIIQGNCLLCHSNAARLGGVSLEGHANLKVYADNGKLLGSIKHLPGFYPMPQSAPKLAPCTIARIEQWIEDGALDN